VCPDLASERAESGYEILLKGWLSGELRLVNSGLARERRCLSDLLDDSRPSVSCADGSDQMFKRTELQYLAGLLDEDERAALLLPVLIEMAGEESEAMVLCSGDVERKVVSSILGMELHYERPGRIRLYRPQLALLRKRLRTTTQYAFSSRTDD